MKNSLHSGRSISEDTIKKILEVYSAKRWDEIANENPSSNFKSPKSSKGPPSHEILRLGKELMAAASKKYVTIASKNDSEERWLHLTAQDPFIYKEGKKSSTFSDRVDAMVVLIHNNCVFNWVMFSELLGLVRSEKIRVKTSCLDLTYSAFMEVLPVRKLRYLDKVDSPMLEHLGHKLQPYLNSSTESWDDLDLSTLTLLIALTFEDFLKGIYSAFIQELSDLMNRGVDFLQKKASNLALQMLIQKPEQEEILLDLIVGRLGHRDNKMSSYVFKMLDTLLLNHEKMKRIVVKRILTQITGLVGKIQTELNNPGKREAEAELKRGRKKRRRTDFISTELVHVLKVLHRCVLYISKLHYSRDDFDTVETILTNNIKTLSLFVPPPSSTPTSSITNGEGGRSKLLYRHEECNRTIKILLLSMNKLLSYYKGADHYEAKRGLLLNSQVPQSLYNLSHKTRSASIIILLLTLLYHLDPNKDQYRKILYNTVLNFKVYESSNLYKFFALLQQILLNDGPNPVLTLKLLQATLCNYNPNTSHFVLKMILKFAKDDDNQWPLYPLHSSYDPHLLSILCGNQKKQARRNPADGKGPELEDFNPKENTLYHDLSLFSGCLQPDYTLEKYWARQDRRCEPHQRAFQLYFQSKSLLTQTGTESAEPLSGDDDEDLDNVEIDSEVDSELDDEIEDLDIDEDDISDSSELDEDHEESSD